MYTQVHKTTIYEWKLPVFGYYRCSYCGSLNTFTVRLFKSSLAVDFKLVQDGNDRQMQKLAKQRRQNQTGLLHRRFRKQVWD